MYVVYICVYKHQFYIWPYSMGNKSNLVENAYTYTHTQTLAHRSFKCLHFYEQISFTRNNNNKFYTKTMLNSKIWMKI